MIDRNAVLGKYDHHCAYCGCEITLKTMQVDHKIPKCSGGTDDIENLLPACRLCNHYKRGGSPNHLRWLLVDMHKKLKNIYIFRVAEKYGMINWKEWSGEFYFEKIDGPYYDPWESQPDNQNNRENKIKGKGLGDGKTYFV